MSEIKGIIMDLDNTLYDYHKCNDFAKKKLFEKVSKDLNIERKIVEDSYDNSRKEVKKHTKGTAASHSRLLYIQKMLEILEVKNYVSKSLLYEELFWKHYFEKMELVEHTKEFLSEIKRNGIKLCIVTDLTANIQMKKIVHLGIGDHIDYIVTSEEAGAEKPDKKIFLIALQKMNLPKESVVVIGDDREKDIKGAEKCGLRALYADHETIGKNTLSF